MTHPHPPRRWPRLIERAARHLATGLAPLALAACYVPAPTQRALLQVDGQGHYTLNGTPVPAAQLVSVLTAQHRAGLGVVEIRSTPQTDMALVRQAVQAVEQSQARVAFAPLDHVPVHEQAQTADD